MVGEETTAAGRAIAAADFANGISHVLDFRTHLFVNTDLTVTLLRDPVGPWVEAGHGSALGAGHSPA